MGILHSTLEREQQFSFHKELHQALHFLRFVGRERSQANIEFVLDSLEIPLSLSNILAFPAELFASLGKLSQKTLRKEMVLLGNVGRLLKGGTI